MYIELKVDEETNRVVDDIIQNLLGKMDIETLQMYFDFDKYLADIIRYDYKEEIDDMYMEVNADKDERIDSVLNKIIRTMDIETLQMYFDFDKYLADFVRYNELEEIENGYIVDIYLR